MARKFSPDPRGNCAGIEIAVADFVTAAINFLNGRKIDA